MQTQDTQEVTIPIERQVQRNAGGDKWLKKLSLANLDALTDDARERSEGLYDLDLVALVEQLGGAIYHVSGGRLASVGRIAYLPVSNGYVVAIELDASDTYTVRRLVMRSGRLSAHGVRERVYVEDLAETVIRAGAFRSYGEADWVIA